VSTFPQLAGVRIYQPGFSDGERQKRDLVDRCIKAHVVIAVIASSALNEIFDAGATEFAETFDESRRQNFDITGPAVMVQRPQYLDVMSLCGAHARVDMREVEM